MEILKKLTAARRRAAELIKDPATAGLWRTLVDRYSERAHFVAELLQNADDAGARWCKFRVNEDSVEFIHNGIEHFTVSDPDTEADGGKGHLNALTSIAASEKSATNKIGKFGIGFKSVFAYTDKPHIEDGTLCVDIEEFIVPVESKEKRYGGDGTYFFMPLKEKDRREEIIERLNFMHAPLLYLSNLEKIEWESSDGRKGEYYKKSVLEDFRFSDENVKSVRTTLDSGEYLSIIGRHAMLSVKKGKSDFEEGRRNIFCFFPTMHKEPLPYTLHAPFLLTDSRESIKEDENWNKQMIQELAELQLYAVERLGNNFLPLLPIDYRDFFTNKAKIDSDEKKYLKSMFYPLCRYARKILETCEVYECEDGKKRRLNEIKIVENKITAQLFGEKIKSHFSIITDRRLIAFIKEIKGEVVTLTNVLELLKREDYVGKENSWFVSLYSALARQNEKTVSELLYIPTKSGIKKVFSDGAASVSINEICSWLTEDGNIYSYLVDVLKIPENENAETQIADILTFFKNPKIEQAKEYLGKLAKCYYELGMDYEKKQILTEKLSTIPFILTNDESLSLPSECVIESDISRDFYEGVEIKMLTKQTIIESVLPEHRDAFYTLLSNTGCSNGLLFRRKKISVSELEAIETLQIIPSRRDEAEDVEIIGLNELLLSPTLKKSLSFSRMLSMMVEEKSFQWFDKMIEGEILHFEPRAKNGEKVKLKNSSAYRKLFCGKWIVGKAGVLSPKEIKSSSEMAEEYGALPISFFLYLEIKKEKNIEGLLKTLFEAGLTEKDLIEIAENVKKGRKVVFI